MTIVAVGGVIQCNAGLRVSKGPTGRAGRAARPTVVESRRTWWLWSVFERRLSALAGVGSGLLFGGFLVWFIAWSVGIAVLLRSVTSRAEQQDLAVVAGRLMTAIGTLFALLTAFVITNQWDRSRDAERVIGAEADASVRLALASGAGDRPCM